MLVTLPGIVTLVRLVQKSERIVPDAGDAAGNRDAGQAGAEDRTTIPNAGDQQAVDVGWNGHSPARPGVSGDGDGVRIAGIYAVT